MNIFDGLFSNVASGGILSGVLGTKSPVSTSSLCMPVPEPVPDLTDYIKIGEKIYEILFEDHSISSSAITEEDIAKINEMIENGRKQGLKELNIKINKNFAHKLKAKATLPFELPVDISMGLEKTYQGEYMIKVIYANNLESIDKLNELRKKGAITEEEYQQTKSRLLERI